ncbi:MAG: hypothetical protein LBR32_01670 [Propionibacteriaceae bacterium]|jgi:hypothetical protein|nr:hypothetical protein [Propionibacteriaceae bacterium]
MTPTRAPLTCWGRWSLGWTLFVGLGAVAGTTGFWFGADYLGLTQLLPAMQVLPLADVLFQTTFWPGLFLLVLIGLPHLTAAGLILARRPRAWLATVLSGAILMGWTGLQFWVFPGWFGGNPLSPAYFAFGLAEAVMACLWRRAVRPSAQVPA